MKIYQSHKVVRAAKIKSAQREDDGRWTFVHEDGTHDTTTIDEATRFKITNDDLGYVIHFEDGHVSWSPSSAFEAGYEPIRERITEADLDSLIVDEAYYVFPGTTLTVCRLSLKNGYNVTGESACASPIFFDEGLGRKIAKQNARQKIWALEGYHLRHTLAAIG